ncbi:MAG TPA: hypothetical protein VFV65_07165 [Gemmatimonadales bacterium]|nr:hypothetical protein [Gemmatimonadales bacterium]
MSKRGLGRLAVLTALLVLAWMAPDVSRDRELQGRPAADADREAITALSDSASRLGLRVRTSQARRRVDSALTSARGNTDPAVLVLGGGAAALAPRVDSHFARLGFPGHPRVPVHLALVAEDSTGPRPAGMLRAFTLLPGASPADGCTAVLVVPRGGTVPDNFVGGWTRLPLGGALGPCWFLAAFGLPGPGVRRWLDSRYWDVAGTVPPTAAPSGLSDANPGSTELLGRLLLPLLSPFLARSALDAGCAGNRPELCEVALLAPLPSGILPDGIAGSEGLQRRLGDSQLWTLGLTVSAKGSLLARMVDDLGAERFATFWGSGAEVPEAFRSAAGESLGEWYRRRLRRELEEAGFPGPVEPPYWPAALGFLGVAIAASLWQAGRRQVR